MRLLDTLKVSRAVAARLLPRSHPRRGLLLCLLRTQLRRARFGAAVSHKATSGLIVGLRISTSLLAILPRGSNAVVSGRVDIDFSSRPSHFIFAYRAPLQHVVRRMI
jgi:hypothetical protein